MLEHIPSPAKFSNGIRGATGSCYAFRLAVVHGSKLDKPFVTINSLARASVVSSAIKQNKEYLSTIIDPGFSDVTTYILDFLANSIQGIGKEEGGV